MKVEENLKYENRISALTQEINGLQGKLRGTQQELDGYKKGTNEYEYKITQINQEWQYKFSSFETRFTQLNQ